jgi:hypothetical protein
MVTVDLQPALKEGQCTSRDMEEAPAIRNAPVTQLRVCFAEYACQSGEV